MGSFEAMPVVKRPIKCIDLEYTLRTTFKKHSFRPVQREVIQASLDGHDVFLQAATSFGKSLCFQLPACVDYGVTIVVSPLLALMNNQVAALREAGVFVNTINSTTTRTGRAKITEDLQCGHPRTKLLYVTPELCMMDSFRNTLRKVYENGQLCRFAIDEAHCISEWGHDFRPSFSALIWVRETFPDVPMMCLTATATKRVRDDIVTTLGLNPANMKLFTMTTSRPNLHYEVRFKSDIDNDQYTDFVTWLRSVHARRSQNSVRRSELSCTNSRVDNVSGIIYTLTRGSTEQLASQLSSDNIGAKPFHAGLTTEQKDDHLAGWVANRPGYDIIVATTAFGMGIDKNNVRFVVHWQLPKSFEGFYQEAGRAGRDGKAAFCLLYYAREDRDRASGMLQREASKGRRGSEEGGMTPEMRGRAESLQALVKYCEATNQCRHRAIAKYFGELKEPVCDWACDWHKDARDLVERKDEGLASEEWCSTQRPNYEYDEYE